MPIIIVAMAKPGKIEPHGCRWSLPHFINDREVLFRRGQHLELSRLNNGTWLQKHTHTENGGHRPSWTQIDLCRRDRWKPAEVYAGRECWDQDQ